GKGTNIVPADAGALRGGGGCEEGRSMAALLRLVGPAVARYFSPGPDDLIDSFFDGTPMPVTVEVYPFMPATRITGQKLLTNGPPGDSAGAAAHTPPPPQSPLGADAGETAGAINPAILAVTAAAAPPPHSPLRYSRAPAAPVGQGGPTTATIPPATTMKK